MGWEYDFKIYPIIDHMVCLTDQEGFGDLIDVFKLEQGEFKAVKFVVEVMIKNCIDDKTYYVYDLTKAEKTESISLGEFEKLKGELERKYKQ